MSTMTLACGVSVSVAGSSLPNVTNADSRTYGYKSLILRTMAPA